MYLREEEVGNAAAHSSLEKSHGQQKLEAGERRVSKKNKDILAKLRK